MPKPNPFPNLCLSDLSSSDVGLDSFSLNLTFADPVLEFALRRQAEALDLTVEDYCKQSILEHLEADEEYNQDHIDPDTGLIRIDQRTEER